VAPRGDCPSRRDVSAPVFKGRTCLEKRYFETYRFSEDLDFTLTPEAVYAAEALTRTLREVTAIATT